MAAPPSKLSEHPDLKDGDVYMHRTPRDSQLWMWEAERKAWTEIDEYYKRSDGRYITFTDKRRDPSWVSASWATRKMRER